jgi:predicted metal-binding membrane protein
MSAASGLERLLKRDVAITVVGLIALCALTWAYVVAGAGLGMSAWDMTTLTLLPHAAGSSMDMGPMTPMTWGPGDWALMVGMWWTMMIAMMTPAAAPTILLYARVHRHAFATGAAPEACPATGMFVAGYFLVWLGFSIAAAVLHQALQRVGIVSAITMGVQVGWVSGAALILTGLYQMSPLKHACLSHCRSPAAFLSRHWRPGALGASRLGVMHGAYCVGCCWMLMVLLFVGGVMNLAWIAALSLLVLAEKLLPAGRWVGRGAGIVLIAWGTAIMLGWH